MTLTYLYQDRFVPKEELRISPEDRGYYFGDGVYEVFRVYNGSLYEAPAHFERWERSAAALRIPLPTDSEVLTRRLEELIRMNSLSEGTVYMQVSRGAAPRSHPFPTDTKPILMAYTAEAKRPLSTMKEGITAVTMEDIRWLRCDLKTLNLLANVMAKQHAVDQGAGDVILHRNGTVTECSASNIMIVKDGCLITHPANHLILHGITRAVVLRISQGLGIAVKEAPFTLDELRSSDEVFITGTTVEITPVISIDSSPVADGTPGQITQKLQQEFEKTIST
ncbi:MULTISPECIES: D-amino-acid transaminase [unclassified Paenibacillus]|uniref:D-amino-acid transaminase n=1 Tax=unclassified Paenibacillus TaxID=185978 RepID=UPI001AE66371|nr:MULTISPECIES: D-amino-acid transaminase [unclassified Paenibacillus]MBP1154832.1 D-alanine transaminase [Paenibacillus sp. PvP091]MBP1169784.1 D-alanine transaminase [Paenibacillus sp. PvR098]MBP2440812.1 D-alanine transaminase [Paenibacillus sp. PvP052]